MKKEINVKQIGHKKQQVKALRAPRKDLSI